MRVQRGKHGDYHIAEGGFEPGESSAMWRFDHYYSGGKFNRETGEMSRPNGQRVMVVDSRDESDIHGEPYSYACSCCYLHIVHSVNKHVRCIAEQSDIHGATVAPIL